VFAKQLSFVAKTERAAVAITIGLILFAVSYAAEVALFWLHMQGVQTIVDNVLIGFVGAAAAYLWVRYEDERHARVREKMILLVELNHHIREALATISESSLVQDEEKRLQLVDEAVERVDRVLVELVPTVGEVANPRLSLTERKV
jgi:two-component sensor histidine kinase